MRWIYSLLILYVIVCAGIFFIQERVIFNPDTLPDSYVHQDGEEVEIPIGQNLTMNCVHSKGTGTGPGVILYFHGNRGTARRGSYQVRQMAGHGYHYFVPDYRGYGKTEGRPRSGRQLRRDANKAYAYLKKHYAEEDIIVVGYSLGTGMASYVAAKNNPGHLVLLAPYTSLTDMKNQILWFVPDFLLKYKLPTSKFIRDVECPITILHGTNDQVIDFKFAEDLKRIAPERVDLIPLKGEGHRGLIFDPRVGAAFDRILSSRHK